MDANKPLEDAEAQEVKPKIEIIPWALLIDKLFKKEKIVGLEAINFFDFNFLLYNHIENYTVFIESRFLFNTLKEQGKKLIIKKLLKADSMLHPIYYYMGLNNDIDEGFGKLIQNESRIKSVVEQLDKNKYRNTNGSELLRRDLDNIFLPNAIVDMLKIIYHNDENNRKINAIVLFSNNVKLIRTVQELINNDIAVYLGVSKMLKTSPKLMSVCSGIFDIFAYLENLDALMPIKG